MSDTSTPHIRTPDQRLRVFVSSTLQEVAAEHAAAREAITQLRLAPVRFELGVRPHPPKDLYRANLEQRDIFAGIYWQKYGWVTPDMNISGPEDGTGLITLIDPGGTGKTRLAIEAARDTLDHFANGAFFAALARVRQGVIQP